MRPWKVLGWLLVALLCLLLTAGAYGLALLWGWSLPSVWWLAAIAGAGAGVALIIFLFRTMRDDTHEPAADAGGSSGRQPSPPEPAAWPGHGRRRGHPSSFSRRSCSRAG